MRKTLSVTIVTLLATLPALGSVQFVLSPSTQATPPGGVPNACFNLTDCVIYGGSISVTPGDSLTYFLSGLDIVFNPLPDPTGLTHEPNFFFSNVSGVVDAGFPYLGPIFEIDVPLNMAPNIYTGTATLLGGTSFGEFNSLATTDFTLIVVAPEPGYLLPIALGCLVLLSVFHDGGE